MPTVEYIRPAVPTPKQSRYVKVARFGILPADITPYIKPGQFEGIDNHYKIKHFQVYLSCSAAVANRTITIQIAQVTPFAQSGSVGRWITGNIAASESGRIILSPIGVLDGVTLAGLTVNGLVGLTNDIIISGDDRIEISIGSPQAGDVVSFSGLFEYLNHIDNIQES